MTLHQLAYRENELQNKVIELCNYSQSDGAKEHLQDIFLEYKRIHQGYAELSLNDIEALKRGLFIQWYALTEPNYLTGIGDLDIHAENVVVQNLQKVIATGKIDNELNWMLNYYANWEWVFKRLESFLGFDNEIVNEQNNKLPINIDKETMEQRGQMGKYWNSLSQFNKL